MNKTDLIQQIHEAHASLYDAIEGLEPQQFSIPARKDGWSTYDILAHCMVWSMIAADGIEDLLRNDLPRQYMAAIMVGVDEYNINQRRAWLRKSAELADPLAHIRSGLDEACNRLLKAVDAVEEKRLFTPGTWSAHGGSAQAFIADNDYDHKWLHATEIREWRQNAQIERESAHLSDAIVSFNTQYQRLLTYLADYPKDRQLKSGAAGKWSPRDILAHFAGWLVEANRRFDEFDADITSTFKYDWDSFNAASVGTRAHLTWAETVEEVQQAYTTLSARAAQITPDTTDSRYKGWLDGLAEDCKLHYGQLHVFITESE